MPEAAYNSGASRVVRIGGYTPIRAMATSHLNTARPFAPPDQALPGQKRPTGHGRPNPVPGRGDRVPLASAHGERPGAGRDRGRAGPRWAPAVTAGDTRIAGHTAFTTTTSDDKQHGAGFEPLLRHPSMACDAVGAHRQGGTP